MVASTRRKALEDYAQNVLRANKCKARHVQFKQTVYAAAFAVIVLVCFWGAWKHRTDSALQYEGLLIAIGCALMAHVCLQRKRYWIHVEQGIQSRLDQIMDELRKPGEPTLSPGDLAISIAESIFDEPSFSPGLDWAFKEEPALVFPSPSSELV